MRGDRLSKETIEIMRRAGTYYTAFAIESASERIQKLIKKNLDIHKTLLSIENAVRSGIFTMGFFMLGFPEETEEEMRLTINCAKNSKLHLALFMIVTPFQGTELFERYVKEKKPIPFRNYHYHTNNYNFSHVKTDVLRKLHKSAYRSFYFSPGRAIRIFRDYPFSRIGMVKQILSFLTTRLKHVERMKF